MEIVNASHIERLVVSPLWDHLSGVLFIALLHHLSKLCIHNLSDADKLGRVFGDILLREDTRPDRSECTSCNTFGTQPFEYDSISKAQRIAHIIRHMTKELKDVRPKEGSEQVEHHVVEARDEAADWPEREETAKSERDTEVVAIATAKMRIEEAAKVLQEVESVLNPH